MKSPILLVVLALTTFTAVTVGAVDDQSPSISQPLHGSSIIIQISTVIDTDLLRDDYASKPRSRSPDTPTPISNEYIYMITTRSNVVSGQATAELHIKAIVGDTIKWVGANEANTGHLIVLYDLRHSSEQIGQITKDILTKDLVYPMGNDIWETNTTSYNIFTMAANVRSKGEVSYKLSFVMFEYSRDAGRYEPWGYFTWDPKITIV
ncbi:hypothetical protein M8J76_015776 [Diaphorina citri]|nr:hypothetical protein M8J76_015776 [Diaphorina citri]